MKVEMVMPQMGESITEATVLKWLKNVGDAVKKDEVILEISTDKVDSEIPAPTAGVIVELLAPVGATVAVKSVVAIIDTEAQAGAAAEPKKSSAPETKPAKSSAEPKAKTADVPVDAAEKASSPSTATTNATSATGSSRRSNGATKTTLRSPLADDVSESGVGLAELHSTIPTQAFDRFYSPLVRNLAAQQGLTAVDLAQIPGTGTHGRITKNDVVEYLELRAAGKTGGQAGAPSSATPHGSGKAASTAPSAPKVAFDENGLFTQPFDKMRTKIAEHMVRSKSTSPHAYTVAEVDVTNVARYREIKQKEFTAREGFKLSFTPFFLEASAKALVQYPAVNGTVEGENHIWKKHVNLGCAVALGTTGLIVPVIKNAEELNLVGLAKGLNDIAQRARNKKLSPDDVQGGTFTITNPGIFGSIIGYPIINQPQLAILGVGAIKKRPVVIDNMIAIRDIVYLTLSYDHRVIDGALGGTFLNSIVRYLEEWDLERPL